MAQITEDYVSFETAKLLKEKGFDGEWHKHYWGYEPGNEFLTSGSYNSEYDYPAPTLQMAMKWLRKVHNYNIEIYTIGLKSLNTLSWRCVIYNLEHDMECCYYEDDFKSHEEASEAAIKYCLENLI